MHQINLFFIFTSNLNSRSLKTRISPKIKHAIGGPILDLYESKPDLLLTSPEVPVDVFVQPKLLTMNVKWKTVKRRSKVGDNTSPFLYYPMILNNGEVTLKDLAEDISDMCTVTYIDVSAVLVALEKLLPKKIKSGHIVRLNGMGNLYLSGRCSGEQNAKDVSAENIKEVGIRYRTSKELIDGLHGIKFEKQGGEIEEEK